MRNGLHVPCQMLPAILGRLDQDTQPQCCHCYECQGRRIHWLSEDCDLPHFQLFWNFYVCRNGWILVEYVRLFPDSGDSNSFGFLDVEVDLQSGICWRRSLLVRDNIGNFHNLRDNKLAYNHNIVANSELRVYFLLFEPTVQKTKLRIGKQSATRLTRFVFRNWVTVKQRIQQLRQRASPQRLQPSTASQPKLQQLQSRLKPATPRFQSVQQALQLLIDWYTMNI